MPQMMPLNWITLMLFFTLIFYYFNILNFFSLLHSKKKINFYWKTNKLNWKW
nr:ATP synthase subunit 8 [Psylliodes dulcamarae]